MPSFSDGYALVVGIGDHQDPAWNAPYALEDARGVAATLVDPAAAAYPPGQVRQLPPEEATRNGIIRALDEFIAQVDEGATVVIFWVGHGALGTDDEYYFATRETTFEGGRITAGTGLKAKTVFELLRRFTTQKLLVVVNTCYSGHVLPLIVPEYMTVPRDIRLEALVPGEQRALITATRSFQESLASPGAPRTSVGQALIDGLRGAGVTNSHGFIGLFELYEHLYIQVTRAAEALHARQHPTLTLIEGVGPFPIGHYHGGQDAPLDRGAIQRHPPQNMAVELVEERIVRAVSEAVVGNLSPIFRDLLLKHVPSNYNASLRRMVEEYEEVFGGRDPELAALNAFLAQDAQPYALLLAPTGRGKTALLIHWAARVQALAKWTVVFAPISRRYGTADAEAALAIVAHGLAAFHGESLQSYNTAPSQLRPLIAEFLSRTRPIGKRLLLVMDGLDEAVGWEAVSGMFPRNPDPRIRIVVSAREMALTSPEDWLSSLGWRARDTYRPSLPRLSHARIESILRQMHKFGDFLSSDPGLGHHIARISDGDPVTIRLLVEALRDHELTFAQLAGMPEGLESYVYVWLKTNAGEQGRGVARRLQAYAGQWVDELERHSTQTGPLPRFLGFCAVALGPLTDDDLKLLDAASFRRKAVANQAAKSVARFIIGDGTPANGYIFSLPRLRELFAEQVFFTDERQAFHQSFVDYGAAWYANRNTPLSDYLRRFWVTHLAEVAAWETARRVLTEVVPVEGGYAQPWAAARFAAEGSYSGYLADLDLLWKYAEEHDDPGLGLRCALIASSIRSLSANLSPKLLVGLVQVGTPEGKWSAAAALEHIRQVPNPMHQLEAITDLINSDCHVPTDLALDVAQGIVADAARALALVTIATHLPLEQQTEVSAKALAAARAIVDERKRAEVLSELAARLPLEFLPAMLDDARDIAIQGRRASVLSQLAARLPLEQQAEVSAEVLAVVRAIAEQDERAFALIDLAARLPLEFLPAMLDDARDIAIQGRRASVLSQLAARLPLEQQAEVSAEALAAVRAIVDEIDRTEMLIDLAARLPLEYLPAMLDDARAVTDASYRAFALSELAARLPLEQQAEVYVEALAAARTIPDHGGRAFALSNLTARLPLEQQAEVSAEALAVVRAIADHGKRAEVLSELAARLPLEYLPAMLDDARAIAHGFVRASVLSQLATRLPLEQQAEVYVEALAVVRAIVDERERAIFLSQLAARLPLEYLPAMLDDARAVTDASYRAFALSELAARLPLEQQAEVYVEALAAGPLTRLNISLSQIVVRLAWLDLESSTHRTELKLYWHQSLRVLASHGRPGLLQTIDALIPWIVAKEASSQGVAAAILHVARAWP